MGLVKKELRTAQESVACDVCERTILKGERTVAYLAEGGERKVVCELCTQRADRAGWIRESAHSDLPVTAHRPPRRRRTRISRLWRRGRERGGASRGAELPAEPVASAAGGGGTGMTGEHAPVPVHALDDGEQPAAEPAHPEVHEIESAEAVAGAAAAAEPHHPRDPRHVRAVPTNALLKVERALELFNGSGHTRTISGVGRTLGAPWVSANPLADSPSAVAVVVAWELSWYRYRIDLADAGDPVMLVDSGHELDELDEALREWNGTAADDGTLCVAVGSHG